MSARLSRTSSGARRFELRFDARAQQIVQPGDQVQQARAAPVGYVDDPPCRGFGIGSQQIAVHHVGNISEITRLFAITVDDRRLAGKHARNEDRNDGGIGAVRILSRPENVEVSNADRLQAVGVKKRLTVVLARQLGSRIR